MTTYYYGWESVCDVGFETLADYGTAVTATQAISWLRSANFTVNENVSREYFVGQAVYRKADAAIKGPHEVSGNVTFWLPDDLDATTLDAWILKMPCDAYNKAHTGTSVYEVPETGVSAYGSNRLQSMTMEIGHNKPGSGTQRFNRIAGCMVDSFTMRARAGERIECSMDFFGKSIDMFSSESFSGPARSTAAPLGWEHVVMGYADAGSTTVRQEFTGFEFTINNNLTRNYNLGSASPARGLAEIIPGRQEISGTATLNMSTTTGMALYDALLSHSTAPYTPHEGITNKEFHFDIRNFSDPTTEAIEWSFYNVVIGEIPMDIDPTKVQEITFPWTAQYYKLELITADATPPTNWDNQS